MTDALTETPSWREQEDKILARYALRTAETRGV